MQPQVIGISGSPVNDANTDRLIRAVLKSTGLKTDFIKLSDNRVQPCRACLGCVKDNRCKVQDDFQGIAEKVRHADAIVIGGYPPYGSLDGFTKAFLERLFSLRHLAGHNRGKLAVTVVTGIGRGIAGLDEASEQLKYALTLEEMEILGQLKVTGNTECLVCGFGQDCPVSSLPWIFGEDTQPTPEKLCKVEDQKDLWQRAASLGRTIAAKLENCSMT